MTVQISPSQLKDFNPAGGGCMRYWGFKKIDKIPVPPKRSSAFGTFVHAIVAAHYDPEHKLRARGADEKEIVFLNDEIALAKKCARALIGEYPDRIFPIVEGEVRVPRRGFEFFGYSDLAYMYNGAVWVADHKTSSNPREYALTPDRMLLDEQALIYAAHTLDLHDVDEVNLQWTYVATKTVRRGMRAGDTMAVRATMSRDHVFKHLPLLDDTARQILEARKARTGNDLPPNPDACGNYGGCPFTDHCILTTKQRLQHVLGESGTMPSLREMMQAKGRAMAEKTEEAPARTNGRPRLLPPPRVNSPEAPADPVAASRSAGKMTTDRKAEAAAAERKSPTTEEILRVCADRGGVAVFSSRSDGAEPFAHGRTLAAMERDGLITVAEDGSKRSVALTDRGWRKIGMDPPDLRDDLAYSHPGEPSAAAGRNPDRDREAWLRIACAVVTGNHAEDYVTVVRGIFAEYQRVCG